MGWRRSIRRALWGFGYDIAHFTPTTHPTARIRQLLRDRAVDTVLDVGANAGQFAHFLREDLGYRQRIISFEPLSAVYAQLAAKAAADPLWSTHHFALGAANERREINVSVNGVSSSILPMHPSVEQAVPAARFYDRELIEIRTLDSIFDDACAGATSIYLKLDTQGYEHQVLTGAERVLPRIDIVQMEMALMPLYEGEMRFGGLMELMQGLGYRLVGLEQGSTDPHSGAIQQVDGIFCRGA